MPDAQNERTKSRGRRRGKPRGHRKQNREPVVEPVEQSPEPVQTAVPAPVAETVAAKFTRPDDIAAPSEKVEIYCTHHMAVLPEAEPVNTRPNSEMTTLRHLPVDRFGEATLFCDCLHNGPHEWPPSLQRVEHAVELDQFLTASTNDT